MTAGRSLAMAGEGNECMVREVVGSTWASTRLREMGFVERARIKVLKIDGRGIIVGVNGTRFALSMGLASRVMLY
ncbi:MAG: FeoA domain-containing protein [Methanomassiliicoccus sp.]|nr:FeoA domain-containing protein [Methanomassiliicoccus sp.]